MAWQVSKRVWGHAKDVKLNYKVMLLALADKADENGICWPKFDTSYKTLGEMVGGLDRRSAMRLIDNLVEAGHIVKQETVGRGNSNIFIVTSGLSAERIQELRVVIGDNPVTISNEESEEPQEEMVTTFTPNGDNPVTNYELNGDNPVTQSNKSPSLPTISPNGDSGNEPQQSEFSQPAFSEEFTLDPDTPETRLLFEKINSNRQVRGRNQAKKFKSLEQKQKCLEAVTRLGYANFEASLTKGLETGLTDLTSLVNWVSKWGTKSKNGAYKNGPKPKNKQPAAEPGPIDPDTWKRMVESTR